MTEMIRELMIQSVGAFSGGFWFFPCWSICRGNIWFMRALPEVPDGWRTWYRCRWEPRRWRRHFFSSLAAALLSQVFCTRVKSARHDLSGGRNPADGAGRIDLPERLFSDTGTDKMVQFLSDPDDPDSGGDGGCHLYCGFTVPSAPE